jgi:hypothetical protein
MIIYGINFHLSFYEFEIGLYMNLESGGMSNSLIG